LADKKSKSSEEFEECLKLILSSGIDCNYLGKGMISYFIETLIPIADDSTDNFKEFAWHLNFIINVWVFSLFEKDNFFLFCQPGHSAALSREDELKKLLKSVLFKNLDEYTIKRGAGLGRIAELFGIELRGLLIKIFKQEGLPRQMELLIRLCGALSFLKIISSADKGLEIKVRQMLREWHKVVIIEDLINNVWEVLLSSFVKTATPEAGDALLEIFQTTLSEMVSDSARVLIEPQIFRLLFSIINTLGPLVEKNDWRSYEKERVLRMMLLQSRDKEHWAKFKDMSLVWLAQLRDKIPLDASFVAVRLAVMAGIFNSELEVKNFIYRFANQFLKEDEGRFLETDLSLPPLQLVRFGDRNFIELVIQPRNNVNGKALPAFIIHKKFDRTQEIYEGSNRIGGFGFRDEFNGLSDIARHSGARITDIQADDVAFEVTYRADYRIFMYPTDRLSDYISKVEIIQIYRETFSLALSQIYNLLSEGKIHSVITLLMHADRRGDHRGFLSMASDVAERYRPNGRYIRDLPNFMKHTNVRLGIGLVDGEHVINSRSQPEFISSLFELALTFVYGGIINGLSDEEIVDIFTSIQGEFVDSIIPQELFKDKGSLLLVISAIRKNPFEINNSLYLGLQRQIELLPFEPKDIPKKILYDAKLSYDIQRIQTKSTLRIPTVEEILKIIGIHDKEAGGVKTGILLPGDEGFSEYLPNNLQFSNGIDLRILSAPPEALARFIAKINAKNRQNLLQGGVGEGSASPLALNVAGRWSPVPGREFRQTNRQVTGDRRQYNSATPLPSECEKVSINSSIVIKEYHELDLETQQAIRATIQKERKQGGNKGHNLMYYTHNNLLALRGKEIIGFLKYTIPKSGKRGKIEYLAVAVKERLSGMGRRLLIHCLEKTFLKVDYVSTTHFISDSIGFLENVFGKENLRGRILRVHERDTLLRIAKSKPSSNPIGKVGRLAASPLENKKQFSFQVPEGERSLPDNIVLGSNQITKKLSLPLCKELNTISNNPMIGFALGKKHIHLHSYISKSKIYVYEVTGTQHILYTTLPGQQILVLDIIEGLLHEQAANKKWVKKIQKILNKSNIKELPSELPKMQKESNREKVVRTFDNFAEENRPFVKARIDNKRPFIFVENSISNIHNLLSEKGLKRESIVLGEDILFDIKEGGRIRGRFGLTMDGLIAFSPNKTNSIEDADFIIGLIEGLLENKGIGSSPLAEHSSSAVRILLVENNDFTGFPLLNALRRAGYSVSRMELVTSALALEMRSEIEYKTDILLTKFVLKEKTEAEANSQLIALLFKKNPELKVILRAFATLPEIKQLLSKVKGINFKNVHIAPIDNTENILAAIARMLPVEEIVTYTWEDLGTSNLPQRGEHILIEGNIDLPRIFIYVEDPWVIVTLYDTTDKGWQACRARVEVNKDSKEIRYAYNPPNSELEYKLPIQDENIVEAFAVRLDKKTDEFKIRLTPSSIEYFRKYEMPIKFVLNNGLILELVSAFDSDDQLTGLFSASPLGSFVSFHLSVFIYQHSTFYSQLLVRDSSSSPLDKTAFASKMVGFFLSDTFWSQWLILAGIAALLIIVVLRPDLTKRLAEWLVDTSIDKTRSLKRIWGHIWTGQEVEPDELDKERIKLLELIRGETPEKRIAFIQESTNLYNQLQPHIASAKVSWIIEMLSVDLYARVRIKAAEALGIIGKDDEVLRPLMKATKDSHPGVRKAAQDALEKRKMTTVDNGAASPLDFGSWVLRLAPYQQRKIFKGDLAIYTNVNENDFFERYVNVIEENKSGTITQEDIDELHKFQTIITVLLSLKDIIFCRDSADTVFRLLSDCGFIVRLRHVKEYIGDDLCLLHVSTIVTLAGVKFILDLTAEQFERNPLESLGLVLIPARLAFEQREKFSFYFLNEKFIGPTLIEVDEAHRGYRIQYERGKPIIISSAGLPDEEFLKYVLDDIDPRVVLLGKKEHGASPLADREFKSSPMLKNFSETFQEKVYLFTEKSLRIILAAEQMTEASRDYNIYLEESSEGQREGWVGFVCGYRHGKPFVRIEAIRVLRESQGVCTAILRLIMRYCKENQVKYAKMNTEEARFEKIEERVIKEFEECSGSPLALRVASRQSPVASQSDRRQETGDRGPNKGASPLALVQEATEADLERWFIQAQEPYLILKSSFSRIISLPTGSLPESFFSSLDRARIIFSAVGGWIRMRIIPKYSLGEYIKISAKCLSWVSNMRFSSLANAAIWPFLYPLGTDVTSWPSLVRKYTTSFLTFSSIRNRILAYFNQGDKLFVLKHFSSKMKSSLNMLFSEGRIAFQNFFQRFSRFKKLKDDVDQYAGSLKTKLTMAYVWVNGNIIIKIIHFFTSSISSMNKCTTSLLEKQPLNFNYFNYLCISHNAQSTTNATAASPLAPQSSIGDPKLINYLKTHLKSAVPEVREIAAKVIMYGAGAPEQEKLRLEALETVVPIVLPRIRLPRPCEGQLQLHSRYFYRNATHEVYLALWCGFSRIFFDSITPWEAIRAAEIINKEIAKFNRHAKNIVLKLILTPGIEVPKLILTPGIEVPIFYEGVEVRVLVYVRDFYLPSFADKKEQLKPFLGKIELLHMRKEEAAKQLLAESNRRFPQWWINSEDMLRINNSSRLDGSLVTNAIFVKYCNQMKAKGITSAKGVWDQIFKPAGLDIYYYDFLRENFVTWPEVMNFVRFSGGKFSIAIPNWIKDSEKKAGENGIFRRIETYILKLVEAGRLAPGSFLGEDGSISSGAASPLAEDSSPKSMIIQGLKKRGFALEEALAFLYGEKRTGGFRKLKSILSKFNVKALFYPGFGSDILLPIYLLNPRVIIALDEFNITTDSSSLEDEDSNRETYIQEKKHNGYTSTSFLEGLDLRQPISWELELLGLKREEIEIRVLRNRYLEIDLRLPRGYSKTSSVKLLFFGGIDVNSISCYSKKLINHLAEIDTFILKTLTSEIRDKTLRYILRKCHKLKLILSDEKLNLLEENGFHLKDYPEIEFGHEKPYEGIFIYYRGRGVCSYSSPLNMPVCSPLGLETVHRTSNIVHRGLGLATYDVLSTMYETAASPLHYRECISVLEGIKVKILREKETLLAKFKKFFYGYTSIFKDTLKRPTVNFSVIGYNQRNLFGRIKKLNVATALPNFNITCLQKGMNNFIARKQWRFHIARLKTLWEESLWMSFGLGSKYNRIASLIFLIASFSVLPWLWQPGNDGTLATIYPSWPFSSTILILIYITSRNKYTPVRELSQGVLKEKLYFNSQRSASPLEEDTTKKIEFLIQEGITEEQMCKEGSMEYEGLKEILYFIGTSIIVDLSKHPALLSKSGNLVKEVCSLFGWLKENFGREAIRKLILMIKSAPLFPYHWTIAELVTFPWDEDSMRLFIKALPETVVLEHQPSRILHDILHNDPDNKKRKIFVETLKELAHHNKELSLSHIMVIVEERISDSGSSAVAAKKGVTSPLDSGKIEHAPNKLNSLKIKIGIVKCKNSKKLDYDLRVSGLLKPEGHLSLTIEEEGIILFTCSGLKLQDWELKKEILLAAFCHAKEEAEKFGLFPKWALAYYTLIRIKELFRVWRTDKFLKRLGFKTLTKRDPLFCDKTLAGLRQAYPPERVWKSWGYWYIELDELVKKMNEFPASKKIYRLITLANRLSSAKNSIAASSESGSSPLAGFIRPQSTVHSPQSVNHRLWTIDHGPAKPAASPLALAGLQLAKDIFNRIQNKLNRLWKKNNAEGQKRSKDLYFHSSALALFDLVVEYGLFLSWDRPTLQLYSEEKQFAKGIQQYVYLILRIPHRQIINSYGDIFVRNAEAKMQLPKELCEKLKKIIEEHDDNYIRHKARLLLSQNKEGKLVWFPPSIIEVPETLRINEGRMAPGDFCSLKKILSNVMSKGLSGMQSASSSPVRSKTPKAAAAPLVRTSNGAGPLAAKGSSSSIFEKDIKTQLDNWLESLRSFHRRLDPDIDKPSLANELLDLLYYALLHQSRNIVPFITDRLNRALRSSDQSKRIKYMTEALERVKKLRVLYRFFSTQEDTQAFLQRPVIKVERERILIQNEAGEIEISVYKYPKMRQFIETEAFIQYMGTIREIRDEIVKIESEMSAMLSHLQCGSSPLTEKDVYSPRPSHNQEKGEGVPSSFSLTGVMRGASPLADRRGQNRLSGSPMKGNGPKNTKDTASIKKSLNEQKTLDKLSPQEKKVYSLIKLMATQMGFQNIVLVARIRNFLNPEEEGWLGVPPTPRQNILWVSLKFVERVRIIYEIWKKLAIECIEVNLLHEKGHVTKSQIIRPWWQLLMQSNGLNDEELVSYLETEAYLLVEQEKGRRGWVVDLWFRSFDRLNYGQGGEILAQMIVSNCLRRYRRGNTLIDCQMFFDEVIALNALFQRHKHAASRPKRSASPPPSGSPLGKDFSSLGKNKSNSSISLQSKVMEKISKVFPDFSSLTNEDKLHAILQIYSWNLIQFSPEEKALITQKYGEINELTPLRDQTVLDFVRGIVGFRFTKYGIEEEMVKGTFDYMLLNLHNPEKACEEIYTNVCNYPSKDENTQFNRIYFGNYKQIIKPGFFGGLIKESVKGPVVLDVGAGPSTISLFIVDNRPDIKYYICTDIIDYRRVKLTDTRIEFRLQCAEDNYLIPVKDGEVNTIILTSMLHHLLPRKEIEFFTDIVRTIEQDGKILIVEDMWSDELPIPKKDKFAERFRRFTYHQKIGALTILDWIGNRLIPGPVPMVKPYNFRTVEDWEKIFKSAGLKISSREYLGFPEEKFTPLCLSRLELVKAPVLQSTSRKQSASPLELKKVKDTERQEYIRKLGEFITLMAEISHQREVRYQPIIDSWMDCTSMNCGPVINLKGLQDWYERLENPLFIEYAYPLTRILILLQATIRMSIPSDRLYWYWIALPNGFFEQVFNPLLEVLKEVRIQLKDWGEVHINITHDEKYELLVWILDDLLALKPIKAGLRRNEADELAEDFSRKTQPEANNYYRRLGFKFEDSRIYPEVTWGKLVHLVYVNVRTSKEVRNNHTRIEKVEHAAEVLRDPVRRAYYDYETQTPDKKTISDTPKSIRNSSSGGNEGGAVSSPLTESLNAIRYTLHANKPLGALVGGRTGNIEVGRDPLGLKDNEGYKEG